MAGGRELALLISGKDQTAGAYASAKRNADNFKRSIDDQNKSWLSMSTAVAAGTLAVHGIEMALGAVAGAAGFAGSAAMDFEAAMSSIKAVSGATAEEMQSLQGLALQLGKDTSFSAKEAAAGIEELVKGGLSIQDIMGGGAKAALDLAAAGSISLADAAEIAANAVGQFSLKGADLGHVADLIAGAANASSLSVSDFKFSLGAAGAVAATVGFSFDDLAVAIAEMGKAGIKGSDAGTSLKTMMLNLQPSTKAAAGAMAELGLFSVDTGKASEKLTEALKGTTAGQKALAKATKEGKTDAEDLFKLAKDLGVAGADNAGNFEKWAQAVGVANNAFFDANGKVKSLAEVQGALQEATKDLTQAQRLQALETIFGSDAIRAAAVMSKEGAEGFNSMAEAMGKVTAASVGAEKLNNLKGSIEQLKGSLETAAITAGLEFTPLIKEAVDSATGFVNQAMPAVEEFSKVAVADIREVVLWVGTNLPAALATAQQGINTVSQAGRDLWAVLEQNGIIASTTTLLDELGKIAANVTAIYNRDLSPSIQDNTGAINVAKVALDLLLSGVRGWIDLTVEAVVAMRRLTDLLVERKADVLAFGSAMIDATPGLRAFLDVVKLIADNLDRVRSAANAAAEAIRNIPKPDIRLPELPGRAAGGPVAAGGMYLVGERGPELFVAPRDGTIIPNHRLGGMGGVTINLHVSGGEGRSLREQVREAVWELEAHRGRLAMIGAT